MKEDKEFYGTPKSVIRQKNGISIWPLLSLWALNLIAVIAQIIFAFVVAIDIFANTGSAWFVTFYLLLCVAILPTSFLFLFRPPPVERTLAYKLQRFLIGSFAIMLLQVTFLIRLTS